VRPTPRAREPACDRPVEGDAAGGEQRRAEQRAIGRPQGQDPLSFLLGLELARRSSSSSSVGAIARGILSEIGFRWAEAAK
jgi:hypothetical protein